MNALVVASFIVFLCCGGWGGDAVMEVDPSGGLILVGINGTSYRVHASVCSGGIVFTRPVVPKFLCVKGYYLRRPGACSALGEVVVGAGEYVCDDTQGVTVQSLVSLTNPENPTDHTLALYDNEHTLANLRRYSFIAGMRGTYQSLNESGAPFIVVSNPHNTPPVNLGGICYTGVPAAKGDAFKFGVPRDGILREGSLVPGLFTRPCNAKSRVVRATDGRRFHMADRKRTILPSTLDSIAELLDMDEEQQQLEQRNLVKRRLHPDDNVVLDLKNEDGSLPPPPHAPPPPSKVEESGSVENIPGGSPTEMPAAVLTYPGTEGPSDELESESGEDDVTKKVGGGGGGGGGGGALDDRGEADMLPIEATTPTIYQPMWSGEQSGRADFEDDDDMGAMSGEDHNSAEEDDADDSWEDLAKVLATNELQDNPGEDFASAINPVFSEPTSPHFESYVSVVRSQVKHVLSGCSGSDCNVLTLSQPNSTKWYSILGQFVQVAKAVTPDPIVQGAFFDHALLLFGYYGRVVLDNNGAISESEFAEIQRLLGECAAASDDVMVEFAVRASPADCDVGELEKSSYSVDEWSEYTKEYSSVRGIRLEYETSDPNTYLPPVGARLDPKNWVVAEVMWYALQVTYAKCFDAFAAENPNAFMRMVWYVVETVFRGNPIADAWRSTTTGSLEAYESMLPFVQHSARLGGGANADDFARLLVELDKVSFVVHGAARVGNWMKKPEPDVPIGVAYGERRERGGGLREAKARDRFAGVRERVRRRRDVVADETMMRTSSPPEFYAKDGDEHPKTTLIWDGLAYCLQLNEKENEQGQIVQLGLEPRIEAFSKNGVCV